MNLTETLALLDKLNAIGARHFKSGDFEVSRDWVTSNGKDNNVDLPKPAPVIQPTVTEPYNAQNTKAVEDMIDLLKSKDEALLDKIFPAGA